MLNAIAAVDWSRIPGPAGLYEPERAATGLRALATATGLVRAADAGSRLASGGLVHDHSGAVFPSAVVAAPLLLAIVRHGHPEAGATAWGCSTTPRVRCPRRAHPGGDPVRRSRADLLRPRGPPQG